MFNNPLWCDLLFIFQKNEYRFEDPFYGLMDILTRADLSLNIWSQEYYLVNIVWPQFYNWSKLDKYSICLYYLGITFSVSIGLNPGTPSRSNLLLDHVRGNIIRQFTETHGGWGAILGSVWAAGWFQLGYIGFVYDIRTGNIFSPYWDTQNVEYKEIFFLLIRD